jgi:hypothetical protein
VNTLARRDAAEGDLADHLWLRKIRNVENDAAAVTI